ncbi:MAG: hypothetical protein KW793_04465 [Candidatus Doudnabacteria bacterium]|nr:hypothetical protein [Candidatus Doudnabacteria bacterium]
MTTKFILDFSATEIESEENLTRAEEWLSMAAHYVVSLEYGRLRNCYESAYQGFRDGWRILYRANLTLKSMDEHLREAKPSGSLYEALPRAK